MKPALKNRDVAALLVLILVSIAPLAFLWLRGLTPFWGDLSYLHRPWRLFDAECLIAGRLPLWNPYLYFGMPGLADMQDSLFYPGSLSFWIFSFPLALAVFHAIHYVLAGFFCYLWLRSLGLRRSSCLGGALVFSASGILCSNQPFLNHLAVLSLWPAALLLIGDSVLAGLTLALIFFAGYPPFFLGSCLWLAAWSLISGGRRGGLGAIKGLSWVPFLSACLLIPAGELVLHSKRGAGVELAEALTFGFSIRDTVRWISPIFSHPFDPAVDWWRTCYIGFSAALLAVVGFFRLRPGLKRFFGFLMAAVIVLSLGDNLPVSRWLWEHFSPLRFVRYPGNLTYLLLPVISLLVAAGMPNKRWLRGACVLAVALELLIYNFAGLKGASPRIWSRPSPLAQVLRQRLSGHRYLLSPLALEASSGRGVSDWAGRFYGLTNSPYRLESAGNFGEPLVPMASYRLMDALYSAKSAEAAAAFFPWCDISYLLTPKSLAPSSVFSFEGEALWALEHFIGRPAPSRAYWMSDQEAGRLPVAAEVPPSLSVKPLRSHFEGDDRLIVEGEGQGAGWAFVSHPLYPGWKAMLETPLGEGRVLPSAALSAFQKIPVPAGRWVLRLIYDPWTWKAGLLLSLASWAVWGIVLWRRFIIL